MKWAVRIKCRRYKSGRHTRASGLSGAEWIRFVISCHENERKSGLRRDRAQKGVELRLELPTSGNK